MERVLKGRYATGELLPPEQSLAEEFGVSRIVIREAVKILVEKGLVEVRQGRGTRALPETQWNPLDPQVLALRGEGEGVYQLWIELLEARGVFEVQSAGMAALRISDGELMRLSAHLRAMDSLIHDPAAFRDADAEFHLAVVRAAQNRVLAKLIEPVRYLLQKVFARTGGLPGAAHHAQSDHWQIFRGLEGHDPVQTQTAMQVHLERTTRDLMAFVQAGEPTASTGAKN
jgi:GntR family transcriptional regulator, galactonate operon transcriptional repressor